MNNATDWYIPDEFPAKGWTFPGPSPISQDQMKLAAKMRDEARSAAAAASSNDFSFAVEGIRYRGHRQVTPKGVVYALRRQPETVPGIDQLRFPDFLKRMLLDNSLSAGGLIIVCGETGNGKSTTCAASIVARLKQVGGFCMTIEDPIEMPLDGLYHGEGGGNLIGVCQQTEASQFGPAIASALRNFPADERRSMLLVGEVRDPAGAVEVLRAANSGHLVFTTMHGADIIPTIERFVSMAGTQISHREARWLLADSLRMVLHQTLSKPAADGQRVPNFSVMYSENPQSRVAAAVRKHDAPLTMLSTEIERQKTQVKNNKPPGG